MIKNILEQMARFRRALNNQPEERIDYEAYLKSPEWAEVRRKQLNNQKVCQACTTKEKLHVHHMTYRRLGFEKLKNLKTLCQKCHFELHEQFDLVRAERGWRRDDLIQFTHRFCKDRRKVLGVKLQ